MDSVQQPKILVIDDEADIRHLLTMSIIQMGFDVKSAKDKSEALSILSHDTFDFCLTDLKLPDGSGLDIVSHCHEHYPDMPIAVITAFGNTNTAVEAMKLGAFDFLAKPIELTHLRQLLRQALTFSKEHRKGASQLPSLNFLAGNDEKLKLLRTTMEKLPGSNAPIVIEGAVGTEKNRLAKLIHSQSSRSEFKEIIIDINDLLEDVSLSKANQNKVLFSKKNVQDIVKPSHQTSLIINNLHLLPSHEQKILLQILEEKNYWFEGDKAETILDIRFIICSSQPIIEYLKTQTIHEELFYRINVISICIPSITERSDDLLALFNQCLLWYSDEKSFSSAAKEKLLKHDFHFNYRELENIIEKAVALSTSKVIEESDIILSAESIPAQSFCKELPNIRGELALDEYIERIEIQEIEKALEKTRWNRTEAAKLLGISFRTMRYKMKKLGIE